MIYHLISVLTLTSNSYRSIGNIGIVVAIGSPASLSYAKKQTDHSGYAVHRRNNNNTHSGEISSEFK